MGSSNGLEGLGVCSSSKGFKLVVSFETLFDFCDSKGVLDVTEVVVAAIEVEEPEAGAIGGAEDMATTFETEAEEASGVEVEGATTGWSARDIVANEASTVDKIGSWEESNAEDAGDAEEEPIAQWITVWAILSGSEWAVVGFGEVNDDREEEGRASESTSEEDAIEQEEENSKEAGDEDITDETEAGAALEGGRGELVSSSNAQSNGFVGWGASCWTCIFSNRNMMQSLDSK